MLVHIHDIVRHIGAYRERKSRKTHDRDNDGDASMRNERNDFMLYIYVHLIYILALFFFSYISFKCLISRVLI